jgi:hypothetical protein
MFSDIYANFMKPRTELRAKILPVIISQREAATAQQLAQITEATI